MSRFELCEVLAASNIGTTFNFDHVFSCECVPEKQRFIRACFPELGLLFSDAQELGQTRASCVITGSPAVVPSVAVLIAGIVCTGFSTMNMHRAQVVQLIKERRFDEAGASGQTLKALLSYTARHMPTLVVVENVPGILRGSRGCPTIPADVLRELMGAQGYHSHVEVLNSLDYWLPQNRQRAYFVFSRCPVDETKMLDLRRPRVHPNPLYVCSD